MEEVWKPVCIPCRMQGEVRSFPYEVSNLGSVRRVGGNIKIPQIRNHRGGQYKYVDLWKNNRRKRMCIHRLVALHFVENPHNKKEVNHFDCDTMNNEASNLEWCTRKENEGHKIFMSFKEESPNRKSCAS